MATFFEREQSLRAALKELNERGLSFQGLSSEIGIHEKVIRDFINIEQRTLNPINYNKIIAHFNKITFELSQLNYGGLVEMLMQTTELSIKWDFYTTFDSSDLDLYKNFKKFVINDKFKFFKDGRLLKANPEEAIHLSDDPEKNKTNWDEKGLRGVANRRFFDDPFIRTTALVELKDKIFKREFENLKIYGFSIPSFLWNGDSQEVYLLMVKLNSSEDQAHPKINLSPSQGLFSPKEKKDAPSSRAKTNK